MLLGCIGDDFTGSSDLANTLAMRGMRTVQYSGVPVQPADPAVEAGVVALKSRSIDATDAVRQSLDALEIGPQIDPGVPALRAGKNLVMALKSENFGGDDYFARAANVLAGDAR